MRRKQKMEESNKGTVLVKRGYIPLVWWRYALLFLLLFGLDGVFFGLLFFLAGKEESMKGFLVVWEVLQIFLLPFNLTVFLLTLFMHIWNIKNKDIPLIVALNDGRMMIRNGKNPQYLKSEDINFIEAREDYFHLIHGVHKNIGDIYLRTVKGKKVTAIQADDYLNKVKELKEYLLEMHNKTGTSN
jgi:hypothetical protein